LQEINWKKPCIKNRVEEHIEKAVVEFAIEKPTYGQLRTSNELKKKGLFISPGGVRSISLRHDLETFKKRLKALEAKAAQENFILTEEQARTLEKAKDEKESHGEIESLHPGYLGAQDTYYVGTLKGVGRIYQQTFIDTYCKMAFVKLYDRKNATTVRTPWWLLTCSMTALSHGTMSRRSNCCVSSQTGARNTAATGSTMNTSSTWLLRISTIRRQRPGHHRRTAFASASTRRFRTSFTR
jgi:hypothetical protein